jgi:deoxycytidine triphosphate deaminase
VYLSDNELRAALAEMDVQAADANHPFDPDQQVQPASIDLRVSPIYWRLRYRRGRPAVDLGPSRFRTISPRRHWRRIEVSEKERLTLGPGEMVLARVYEQLTVPRDCAGHLTGRSSFARMGLQVHATGDFINPGWHGHMPLTLINTSKSTLHIPPYTPICQLALVRLTSLPARAYGDVKLNSKYVNDDGGPSYWWRDRTLDALRAKLNSHGFEMEERLLDRIGPPADDILERLERFVAQRQGGDIGSIDDLLHRFAREEDSQRTKDRLTKTCMRGAFPVFGAGTMASLFVLPYGALHYIVWAATVISVPVGIAGLRAEPGQYLGQRELQLRDNPGQPEGPNN